MRLHEQMAEQQLKKKAEEEKSSTTTSSEPPAVDEETLLKQLQESIAEYQEIDHSRHSSDDELIDFVKDKEEKLLFRLGRLLEKKKKLKKKELKRKRIYEEE